MVIKKNILQVLILFVLISIAVLVPTAYAAKATVLSDEELDSISAQGFDIDVNRASAYRSAVIAQSNIAAVAALNSAFNNSINNSINNINNAIINNTGDSAVAIQSNIAAIVAKTGDINDATINNTNTCDIINTYIASSGVQVRSLYFAGPNNTVEINNVLSEASAVAAQSNIGVIAALAGDVYNPEINNLNQANISNLGNAAVASQSNIAVVIAQSNINGAIINNENIATIANTVTTPTGGAQGYSFSYNGVLGSININNFSLNQAADIKQSNIDLLITLGSHISNSKIKNSNIATVINVSR